MYLYIAEILDDEGTVNTFGPFRSEGNAKHWAINECADLDGYSFTVLPLLDPHYIND